MNDPVLEDLLAAIGIAVIERRADGSFHPIARLPEWFDDLFDRGTYGPQATLAGALPFLDEFLPQADKAWRQRSGLLGSGPIAVPIAGFEVLLRATAMSVGGRSLLVVERLTGDSDVRPILQKAREAELEHERVLKQVGEIRAPAATIAGTLDQLLATDLTIEQRGLVENLQHAAAASQAALEVLPATPRAHRRKEKSHLP